jgi:hypothetical protein
MNEEREKALEDLREEMKAARERFESKVDSWWDKLTDQEREWAFYSVCKRIHKGDIVDNGSYRYVLYQTFGFDHSMYVNGMDCGYMAIHNAIFDGEELQRMKGVNRFEVIDDTGRAYVKYLDKDEGIKYALQDDNKTLKVFIDKLSWKEDL